MRVEQRGLAVVHVAHDGDDRGARDHVLGVADLGLDLEQLLLEAPQLDVGAELARDHRRGVDVERRVDRHHHPLVEELLQHVLRADVELVGQVLDGHAFGEGDRPRDRRRRGRRGHHRHARRLAAPILRSPGRPRDGARAGRLARPRRRRSRAGGRRPWRRHGGRAHRLRRQRAGSAGGGAGRRRPRRDAGTRGGGRPGPRRAGAGSSRVGNAGPLREPARLGAGRSGRPRRWRRNRRPRREPGRGRRRRFFHAKPHLVRHHAPGWRHDRPGGRGRGRAWRRGRMCLRRGCRARMCLRRGCRAWRCLCRGGRAGRRLDLRGRRRRSRRRRGRRRRHLGRDRRRLDFFDGGRRDGRRRGRLRRQGSFNRRFRGRSRRGGRRLLGNRLAHGRRRRFCRRRGARFFDRGPRLLEAQGNRRRRRVSGRRGRSWRRRHRFDSRRLLVLDLLHRPLDVRLGRLGPDRLDQPGRRQRRRRWFRRLGLLGRGQASSARPCGRASRRTCRRRAARCRADGPFAPRTAGRRLLRWCSTRSSPRSRDRA